MSDIILFRHRLLSELITTTLYILDMLSRSVFSSVSKIVDNFKVIAKHDQGLPGSLEAIATIRRPIHQTFACPFHTLTDSTTINRDKGGNRQGCWISASCAVYERHTGDATVWIFRSDHQGSTGTRGGSAEVHSVQCLGGSRVETR